ncbi:MAG: cell division/cell wall cluster transcriptional repressor MraZ [Armatimonadetes bacterium]|nr:cell division/cell wall cluster transcriptional repressor MraZ [Armatimonadota bacterium]
MFGGSFTHSLDSAGRFVLPKKFRFDLGLEFFVTKGLGCLCVFEDKWRHTLESELNGLGTPLELLLNPHISRLHRHFFGDMVTTGANDQNRMQLTPEHRRYAGIEDEVVICGCGNYIELWSPKAWEEYKKQNDSVDDLIASGAALLASPVGVATGGQDAGLSQTGPAK